MSSYTALFDASVLYPATIRDVLMQLAITDLFRAKWTADIHDEWIREGNRITLLRMLDHVVRRVVDAARGFQKLAIFMTGEVIRTLAQEC